MRLLARLLAFLLGLATGVAGVGVHRSSLGLVLAVGAPLATVWALREWRRTAVPYYCAGWLLALGGAVLGRPEGDVVLGSDLPGYVLIGTGFVLVVQAVTALTARETGTRGGGAGAAP